MSQRAPNRVGPGRCCWLAAALWIAAPGNAIPGEIRIIANPSVRPSVVSVSELRSIFLETKTSLADGSRVEPVLLKSGPAHEAFLRQFLGKTNYALEAYYRSLVFTGRGLMPAAHDSDDEAVGYVARTPGAIGYVSAGANLGKVKILEIK